MNYSSTNNNHNSDNIGISMATVLISAFVAIIAWLLPAEAIAFATRKIVISVALLALGISIVYLLLHPQSARAADGTIKGVRIVLSVMILIAAFVAAYFVFQLEESNGLNDIEELVINEKSGANLPTTTPSSSDSSHSASASSTPPQTPTPSSISCANIGDTISFGHYRQETNSEEKQEIRWTVLDIQGDRIFLLSKYGLDCMAYSYASEAIWEKSSVRTWLNQDFLNIAFTEEERDQILETEVSADPNPEFDSFQGKSTMDKVFLLSVKEVLQYFRSDSARQCLPTELARDKANYQAQLRYCWWWLRTVGETEDKVTLVTAKQGDIEYDGDGVGFVAGTVRPAIWVRCSSAG